MDKEELEIVRKNTIKKMKLYADFEREVILQYENVDMLEINGCDGILFTCPPGVLAANAKRYFTKKFSDDSLFAQKKRERWSVHVDGKRNLRFTFSELPSADIYGYEIEFPIIQLQTACLKPERLLELYTDKVARIWKNLPFPLVTTVIDYMLRK